MLHRFSLFLFLCLLLSPPSLAQQVREAEARERATEFLQSGRSNNAPRRGAVATAAVDTADIVLAYSSTCDDDTHYYIYNDVADGGFVIVSGDERALPILGYCDHGHFDYATAPENLKWWLEQYDTQITQAIVEKQTAATPARTGASRGLVEKHKNIPDLITTRWGQSEPYNNLVPIHEPANKRYLVGCVATAMATVMNYHQYPVRGQGSFEYISSGRDSKGLSFSSVFSEHTYDWENMTDTYSSESTEAEKQAVAQLMYDCSVAVQMKYGLDASSSYSDLVPNAMATYFGYNPGMVIENRDYYTDEEWDALIYGELEAGRPLYYAGTNATSEEGHAFVCHGYNSYLDMYAFDWGWNGSYNGYFVLSAANGLKPDSYNFARHQLVSVRCLPASAESPCAQSVLLDQDVSSALKLKTTDDGAQLTFNLCNYGVATPTVELGMQARERITGKCFMYATDSIVTVPLRTSSFSLAYPLELLPYNGTYEITPLYRIVTDSEMVGPWQHVRISRSATIPTIDIFDKVDDAPIAVDFYCVSSEVELNRVMQIEHSITYTGEISYTSSDEQIATVNSAGVVFPKALGKVNIQIEATEATHFLATTNTLELEIVQDNGLPKVELTTDVLKIVETASVVLPKENYPGPVGFVSSDPAVASVSSEGLITALVAGKTVIKVSIPGHLSTDDVMVYLDVTVEQPGPVVEEGTYGFAQWPTLPNDNHPSYASLDMGYALQNMTNDTVAQAYIRYEVLHGEESLKRGFFGFNNLPPHTSAVQPPSGWGPVKSIMDKMVVGETYELRFYSDAEYSVSANVPSLTFVWCDTQAYELQIPPCGWTTVCLSFSATLPEGLKSYVCTTYGAGMVLLNPSSCLEQYMPYVVCGEPGSYTLDGPTLADTQCHQQGLLAGYVDESATPETHDYRLMKREGVVAFYALSTEEDQIREGEAVLRLPEGLPDYPDCILIEDLMQGRTPGDSDGNGVIEENDLQLLLEQLLARPLQSGISFFPADADVDDNGVMSLCDLTSIIEKLKK